MNTFKASFRFFLPFWVAACRVSVLQLDPPGYRRRCIPSFWEKLMIQIFNLKLIIQWPTFKRWGSHNSWEGNFLKTLWFCAGKYVGGCWRMGKGDGKNRRRLLSASILRSFRMYRTRWMQVGMNFHNRMVHAKNEKDVTTSLRPHKCLFWWCCHAFIFDKLQNKRSRRSDFSMQHVNLRIFLVSKPSLIHHWEAASLFVEGWAVSSIHHPQAVPPSRGGLEMMWKFMNHLMVE